MSERIKLRDEQLADEVAKRKAVENQLLLNEQIDTLGIEAAQNEYSLTADHKDLLDLRSLLLKKHLKDLESSD